MTAKRMQAAEASPEAVSYTHLDLLDLEWAKGTEPTPHGPIRISLKKEGATTSMSLDLPDGISADVLMPLAQRGGPVFVNGQARPATEAEDGSRGKIVLSTGGHYEIH